MPFFYNWNYSFKTVNTLVMCITMYLCSTNSCNSELVSSKKNREKSSIIKIEHTAIWKLSMPLCFHCWYQLHVVGQYFHPTCFRCAVRPQVVPSCIRNNKVSNTGNDGNTVKRVCWLAGRLWCMPLIMVRFLEEEP